MHRLAACTRILLAHSHARDKLAAVSSTRSACFACVARICLARLFSFAYLPLNACLAVLACTGLLFAYRPYLHMHVRTCTCACQLAATRAHAALASSALLASAVRACSRLLTPPCTLAWLCLLVPACCLHTHPTCTCTCSCQLAAARARAALR